MPTLICEPRDAGAIAAPTVAGLFEGDPRESHGPDACLWTCTWSLTFSCDAFTDKG